MQLKKGGWHLKVNGTAYTHWKDGGVNHVLMGLVQVVLGYDHQRVHGGVVARENLALGPVVRGKHGAVDDRRVAAALDVDEEPGGARRVQRLRVPHRVVRVVGHLLDGQLARVADADPDALRHLAGASFAARLPQRAVGHSVRVLDVRHLDTIKIIIDHFWRVKTDEWT